MKRIHFTDNYLMNPPHPVTVNLIGGGGTGSQVLTSLARIDITLRALGHPGLCVRLYDPDTVSQTNIGRQLFSESEIGLNKAHCLISRVNNFFGNDWQAVPRCYPSQIKDMRKTDLANIFITCTDNIRSRMTLWAILQHVRNMEHCDTEQPLYWMDFGNGQAFGQTVLGTISQKIAQPRSEKYEPVATLPVIVQRVDYSRIKTDDSGPSCSLAEALEKQDLFINSTLAQLGADILWKMFRSGMIEHCGAFLNLDSMKVNPILI